MESGHYKRVWNHYRRVFVRIMTEATGDSMGRTGSVKSSISIHTEQARIGAGLLTEFSMAWTVRQLMFQRERATGLWTMNRDGQLVRQSWQTTNERAETRLRLLLHVEYVLI